MAKTTESYRCESRIYLREIKTPAPEVLCGFRGSGTAAVPYQKRRDNTPIDRSR
jgi:hypothetical protein